IKRGEYVMRLGDCAACHTAGKGTLAGDYVFKTGFGTLLSSNITPDRETGIGDMTERDFFNAVRQGIGSKGMLYPAMPYTAYRKMSDQDLKDLWAYMATVKPVKNAVDENAGMAFPYNIRLAMAGWDMLFFDNSGFKTASNASDEWNRGKYIVDGPGHCSACHSPRNALGAEVASAYLHGGALGTWYAPDLTQTKGSGLGNWTVEDIAAYLKTGTNGKAFAAGPMAEAVQNSTQYMTDADLKAVGRYLKSLPAARDASTQPMPQDAGLQAGKAEFDATCSACHGVSGEGIPHGVPAFAGNSQMLGDPTNMIHAVLAGARAVATGTHPTAAGMPSYAWKLSDQDVADVLNYVRNSWGNAATPVTADRVAGMRAALGAPAQLQNPQ
ncbi:c-type cytochrome, partial [Thioclava sp. BHET1]